MFYTLTETSELSTTPDNMDELRERYPELRFIFDRLEDAEDNIEELKEQATRTKAWVEEATTLLDTITGEIAVVVDDDEEAKEGYTVDALLVKLSCTREQIKNAVIYLNGAVE